MKQVYHMHTNFRNLAIIAHVDHGKTTLVDKLLEAGGAYRQNQSVRERAMDSMDLEREKGITIKAKNTSINWRGYTINIVDTPGHADFGGEVERVMKMVDGVLLVVDAFEGPQAQTTFVLRKALQQGLKPIIVINKIDRPNCNPKAALEKVLELFLELGATEEQFDAPVVYGSAKDGYFVDNLDDPHRDCTPLLEKIVKYIPAPANVDSGGDFQMLVSNIDWDNYVGRVAIGKITSGRVRKGDTVWLIKPDGTKKSAKVLRVFEYSRLETEDSAEGVAGNIVGIAAFDDVDIGETVCARADMPALPFVAIDPPTVSMEISINDGPLSGRDGKNVTSRVVGERLKREMRTNISIKVEESDRAGVFNVFARGTMQIAILVETMRRENYEVCVSRPKVIMQKSPDGKMLEPFETVYVEVPEPDTGAIMKMLNARKGQIEDMSASETSRRAKITARIPTRGLIGFEFELLNITSGHGVFSHLFREYAPYCGELNGKPNGRLVSIESGVSTRFALITLEERGRLFIEPQEEVYAGQIIGYEPKGIEMLVNPCREKHLTNIRMSYKEQTVLLTPPEKFSLERAIEFVEPDELVEATPHNIRMRKRILDANARNRQAHRETKTLQQ